MLYLTQVKYFNKSVTACKMGMPKSSFLIIQWTELKSDLLIFNFFLINWRIQFNVMKFEKEKQSENLRTRTILYVYEIQDNWLSIEKKKNFSRKEELSKRGLLVMGTY